MAIDCSLDIDVTALRLVNVCASFTSHPTTAWLRCAKIVVAGRLDVWKPVACDFANGELGVVVSLAINSFMDSM